MISKITIVINNQLKKLTRLQAQEALKLKFRLAPDIEYMDNEEETEEDVKIDMVDSISQTYWENQPE